MENCGNRNRFLIDCCMCEEKCGKGNAIECETKLRS